MIISPKPYKVARKNSTDFKNYIFDEDLIFYKRGSHAIISGIKMLSKDTKNILVPALFCNETKETLQQEGFNIHFLDVNKNLSWDIDILKSYIFDNRIEAVIICDFFGIKNVNLEPIIKLCNINNIISVRDCCHSPFSYHKTDPQSDLTVFSFRKTFAVQDGGALLLKDKKKFIGDKLESFKIKKKKQFFDWLLSINYKFNLLNPFLYIDFFNKKKINLINRNKKINIKPIIPSEILINYLKNKDLISFTQIQRKKNTKLSVDFLKVNKSFEIIPINFSENFALQTLPVISERAPELIRFLRKNGVGALAWPGKSIPQEVEENKIKYPISVWMNNTIICLPIHQDVNYKHMNYMKQKIIEFNNELIE